MSKKLYLAFMWHMHQPYYKDDIDNQTKMPWVFLHAIKDYYEMPWYMDNFPKIKATFNLVPSLLYQLNEYVNHSANDILIEAIKKDSNPSERDIEIFNKYLFLSNEKNMIKPLPRYYQLYKKFKECDSINSFTYQELIDTKILFLLSWCGNYLRENSEVVKSLIQKGGNFTSDDKNLLLKTLYLFISTIVSYYKELEQSKKIAISTTPFYHPIMPLLVDFKSAKEARDDVILPNIDSNFAPYASLHIKFAIKYFTDTFGKKPKGFWPSEGSISQKVASSLSAHGVQWIATDEDILYKSIHSQNRENIYKNYKLQTQYGLIDVRFRDRELSDAIGFDYSQQNPTVAARNFVDKLKNIFATSNFSPLVNVILDGENAWEFYQDNAKPFFIELYRLLESEDFIECVTMDEVGDLEIQHEYIPRIATGSWINANFDIWIGGSEKNRAWELIALTRDAYLENKNSLDNQKIIKIQKEFMIAQSSDWFWWYGDDHYTTLKDEFDALFRKHLINIYTLMQVEIPNKILKPIIKKDKNSFHLKPLTYIKATMDGNGDFFEWLNSGVVDIQKEFGAMDSKKAIIEAFNYGYDEENLYFMFKGDTKLLVGAEFIFDFNNIELKATIPAQNSINSGDFITVVTKKYIEIKVARELFKNTNMVKFSFKLKIDGDIVQFFPIYSDFIIDFEKLKLKNWFV